MATPSTLITDANSVISVIEGSSDADVQALVAYLKGIEPVARRALPALATVAVDELVAATPVLGAASGIIDPVLNPLVAGVVTMSEDALFGIVTGWFAKKAAAPVPQQ